MPGKSEKQAKHFHAKLGLLTSGFDMSTGPDRTVIVLGYYGSKTRRLEAIVAKLQAEYPEAEIVLRDLKNAPRTGAHEVKP